MNTYARLLSLVEFLLRGDLGHLVGDCSLRDFQLHFYKVCVFASFSSLYKSVKPR